MAAEPEDRPAPTGAQRSDRSNARLLAVQALYQVELTGAAAAAVGREFLEHPFEPAVGGKPGGADLALFRDVVDGVHDRRAELDAAIDAALNEGWTAQRLEILLAIILRCGAYELSARPDVPARVVINEYVELAHAFFGGSEPGMANGVLDTLARRLRPGGLDQSDGPLKG